MLVSVHLDRQAPQSGITLYGKAVSIKTISAEEENQCNMDKSLKDQEVKVSTDTCGQNVSFHGNFIDTSVGVY